MKLLIVSDVHGRHDRLRAVMDMHKNSDALIFLGDGIRDLMRADAYSYGFTVLSVRGNCDGISFLTADSDIPDELCFNFEGFRFLALHGHTRGVKSGIDRAIYAAMSREVDVLLYGHTHIPEERYIPEVNEEYGKPLRVFNPGSLGASGDGKGHFGLIQIKNGNLLMSHGVIS